MKTEQEIRNELEATRKSLENYQNAHKLGEIPFDVLKTEFIDKSATIQTLKWVLGENDRWD